MKIAMNALRRKHAMLLGQIEAAERAIEPLRAKFVLADATMLLFEPDAEPILIPGVRPIKRCQWFKHGEQKRLCVRALREADAPRTTTQVARYVMAAKKLPEDGLPSLGVIRRQVRIVMCRMEKLRAIRRIVEAPDTWWELAGGD